METTPWRATGENQRMRVHYGMQNACLEPYFSITGEISKRKTAKSAWTTYIVGCLHREINQFFPELKALVRWHLCSAKSGPMHYYENSLFWLKERNMASFKVTCVMGATPEDFVCLIDYDMLNPVVARAWLEKRFPIVIQAFNLDMAAYNIT